jgi:hypothetical protein
MAMLEDKLAYIHEMNELKEDQEEQNKQTADNISSSKKSDTDSDDLNWKTLKIDIDLTENTFNNNSELLGIEIAYASKIIEKLDDLNETKTSTIIKKIEKNNNNNNDNIKQPDDNNFNSDIIEFDDDDDDENDDLLNQYDEITQVDTNENSKSFLNNNEKPAPNELILISDIDENGLAFGKLK